MSMDAEILITSRNRISSRGLCYFAREFAMINVLLCVFFRFIACQPSFVISLPEQLHGNYPRQPSKGNYGSAMSKVMLNDHDEGCICPNPKVLTVHGNVCTSSELFCFTSTLRGISSERPNNVEVISVAESFNDRVLPEVEASQSRERTINSSWSSDLGMSILVNGKTVVCSMSSAKSMDELSCIRTNNTSTVSSCRGPLLNQNSATLSMEDVEMIKSGPEVEISPPIRDWGETFLYVPYLDFITVKNNWKDRILHVYRPISLDAQFFPCNFTEAVLGPGEVSSICFMFLPKSLGLSSAHLIFQTSSGGFFLQAEGYTWDSPYGIQSLIVLNISFGVSWRKNLTLFNPYDESIHMEEITIWMTNGKDQIEASCTLQSFSDSNDLSMMVQATVDYDEMVLRNWKSHGSDTQSSVLDDDEVFFNVVPIGSHHSKWITAHNPSQHLVIMQLLLNTGEIINKCRDKIYGLVGLVSSERSLTRESQVPTRDGFSLAEDAIMGHLIFYPLKRCEWRSSVVGWNNLSGVEWLPVLGMGGSQPLMIFERAKPAREIEFELKSVNPSDILHHIPMSTQPCSGPLTKVMSIVNLGDLTLEVRRIRVSGRNCGLDKFVVQNCSFFNLQPGESAKLPISYLSKFLVPFVCQDLELALATGIFGLPLKATIPIIVIGECRRSLFWSQAKKIFAAVLLVAPCAFFIFCCFYPQALGFCAPYYFSNEDGETIPANTHKLVKASKVQYSKKNGRFTSSTNARHLPSLVNDGKALLLIPDDEGAVSVEHGIRVENGETRSCVENLETTLFTQEKPAEEELPSSSGQAENGATEEPILPTNLTVRIGKEKGRRRRKRKGAGTGLTALIEVSSSHSGNSTPSSPLSPMSSTTLTPQRAWPKRNDVELCLENQKAKSQTPEPVRSQFSPKPATLDQLAPTPPPARPKAATKPILLPSATFPGSSHHLSSAARIALHARAPGSRLCGETTANAEDKVKKASTGGKEFTYDIWGDHFSAIDLIGKGRSRADKYARMPSGIVIVDSDDSENSFFVKGPQALLTKYQPELSGSNEK